MFSTCSKEEFRALHISEAPHILEDLPLINNIKDILEDFPLFILFHI